VAKNDGIFALRENIVNKDGLHEDGAEVGAQMSYEVKLNPRPFQFASEAMCILDWTVDASTVNREVGIEIRGSATLSLEHSCLSLGFRSGVCYTAGQSVLTALDAMAQNIDGIIGWQQTKTDLITGAQTVEENDPGALKYFSKNRGYFLLAPALCTDLATNPDP